MKSVTLEDMGLPKKKVFRDVAAVCIIFLVGAAFFRFLFWPTPQLLVTPDFGRSDAWHFSYPTKYALWDSLHNTHTLPVWSRYPGGGFPFLGEGQTGMFYLPNLIISSLSPTPVIAYNLSLVLTVIILGWGVYLWLRRLGVSTLSGLYAALTLMLSGLVMTELPHITLLQGFSLLPWIMWAAAGLANGTSFRNIAILALFISQAMFTGFPQAVFISLLFAAGYFLWHLGKPVRSVSGIWPFLFAVLLGALGSLVQILPSYEFLKASAVPAGFSPEAATYFSFPFKHLITFLSPFFLGNPKYGTYPAFSAFDGSIFWENTGYIGIAPLLLALWFVLALRKNRLFPFLAGSFLASLLLMTGSHSPLYFLYTIWPFSLFRVPSRFIWIFTLSLLTGAAFALTALEREKGPLRRFFPVVVTVILSVQLVLLARTWSGYQLYGPATVWLARPAIFATIESGERVLSIGNDITHNQVFIPSGWNDPSVYLSLRQMPVPDSNLIWKTETDGVYAGRFLLRQSVGSDMLRQSLDTSLSGIATVSALSQKLMNLYSVGTVFSTLPLSGGSLTPVATTSGVPEITSYRNPEALPEAYIAARPVTVTTVQEAAAALKAGSFVPGTSVLLEKSVSVASSPATARLSITRPSDTKTVVVVSGNPRTDILVLNDTYYPGWQATIDGKPTQILAANIRFRAVILPPGSHTVTFTYAPQTLPAGAALTLIGLIIMVIGAVSPPVSPWRGSGQKAQLPGRRP
ncbi:YfhO family protein [Patescibacteria group bacterium]|nr:YfhO family protein [Patescibacteria group bacterium]